jgi:hypothetical protein
MDLALSLRAKGGTGLAARAGTILTRFGATPGRMQQYLAHYTDLLDGFGIRPTLPITARVLARHPAVIRQFVDRGVEFAIHGLSHNDHAVLRYETQRNSIASAMAIFQRFCIPYMGFRAPYLRTNQATCKAVRTLGLHYHSSQAVAFHTGPSADVRGARFRAYRRALELYQAQDAATTIVRPRYSGGLVDIPVALPDDEILVDRLHLNDREQAAVWSGILAATHARGELFTVLLHPERIFDCSAALCSVLDEARQLRPVVWTASLSEIASWWLRRRQTHIRIEVTGPDRYRVTLDGDPQATVLVRGLPDVDAVAWFDGQALARQRVFDVTASAKPVVGVAPTVPPSVLDLLSEEGFPSEISAVRDGFGAYLDQKAVHLSEMEILQLVERSTGPLVRLARWPTGARSALAVTGDIDSITLQDFAFRVWEARR